MNNNDSNNCYNINSAYMNNINIHQNQNGI